MREDDCSAGRRTMKRRSFLALPLAAALPPAHAQGYPERSIKWVLPFPPGSATDGVSRFVAEEVRKGLGQTIVIENMAGADGILAAQAVKRAPADGYTLMISTNSAHGTNPALYNSLPYDPEKDFEPVAGMIRIPAAAGGAQGLAGQRHRRPGGAGARARRRAGRSPSAAATPRAGSAPSCSRFRRASRSPTCPTAARRRR